MSLYREARSGRRRLWLAAGAVGVSAAAVAIAIVVSQGGEPSASEKLVSLQDDIRPALAALELIPLHYESTSPTTPPRPTSSAWLVRRSRRTPTTSARSIARRPTSCWPT